MKNNQNERMKPNNFLMLFSSSIIHVYHYFIYILYVFSKKIYFGWFLRAVIVIKNKNEKKKKINKYENNYFNNN
jgi:hypothetical protein